MCLRTCENIRYDQDTSQWVCGVTNVKPSAMEIQVEEADGILGGKVIRKCNAMGILGGRWTNIKCDTAKPVNLFSGYKIPDSE